MPRRIGIPLADWPAGDRRAWGKALEAGDTFSEGGVASSWRPVTRADAINGYSYWLRFLADNDPLALRLGPGQRATRDRLYAYLRLLMSRMTAMGAAAALGHLALALRAIAPGYDSTNLRIIQNSVQRSAKPRDKRAKLVSSERLAELGSELMASSMRDGEVQDLRAYRDGLLIAILATRPLRVANLAGLRVDRHVEVHGDRILLRIPGEETKNRQLLECWLPHELAACFDRYLTVVRLRFRHADRHCGLWPSGKGCPLTTNWVRQIVIRRTKAAFGHGVNPHLFRDIAATTLALARPDQALLARDLLGHSRFDTTEEHYLHARTADAGRAYARRIDALRKTHQ
ncbi:MAG: site-specific integrase [Betaproteobacteria bacterium]|nr:site-specific integrase [Betaproteobacteria bacterium]